MHLIVRAILQIWPYVNNEPKAHLLVRTGHTLGPTWSTMLQTKGDIRATIGSIALVERRGLEWAKGGLIILQ